jgi:hypothetical protein
MPDILDYEVYDRDGNKISHLISFDMDTLEAEFYELDVHGQLIMSDGIIQTKKTTIEGGYVKNIKTGEIIK